MRAVPLLFVVVAAACSDVNSPTAARKALAPTRAAGAVVANETTPVSFQTVGCNAETIDVTGDVHFIEESNVSQSGVSIVIITTDYTFSGIGLTTGAKYQGGYRVVQKEIAGQGSATVFTVGASGRIIGQGSVPNFWLDAFTGFTVNANGTITRDNTTFSSRCS